MKREKNEKEKVRRKKKESGWLRVKMEEREVNVGKEEGEET